jgi:hypothetical protein
MDPNRPTTCNRFEKRVWIHAQTLTQSLSIPGAQHEDERQKRQTHDEHDGEDEIVKEVKHLG